jgi:hypothetical protein
VLIKAAGGESELGIDDAIYTEPPTADWREAWEITERLIRMMQREVHSRGAKFVMVALSNGIQVHPDRRLREAYARKLGVADLLYPERRIEALARREGIPVVLLAPLMQQHAEKHREYLHGFRNAQLGAGHWNEKGHEVASRLISDGLCRRDSYKRDAALN